MKPWQDLVFLKLGGSLITDKLRPRTSRPDVIHRLAGEIAQAIHENPHLRLLVGHGSGSFGHVPAQKYQTRRGVFSPEGWTGFAEVWKEAAALNRIVMDALHTAGLPAIALPASAGLTAEAGQAAQWNLEPLSMALQAGLLPVVYGDVIFDRQRGATIFSTEQLFAHLARILKPAGILLAGIEDGVWVDFPACTQWIERITPLNIAQVSAALGSSVGTDVTGGMQHKVQEMLALVEELPGLQVRIFSGAKPGLVAQALLGGSPGTLIAPR